MRIPGFFIIVFPLPPGFDPSWQQSGSIQGFIRSILPILVKPQKPDFVSRRESGQFTSGGRISVFEGVSAVENPCVYSPFINTLL